MDSQNLLVSTQVLSTQMEHNKNINPAKNVLPIGNSKYSKASALDKGIL